jgi:hypothetical protein
MAITTKLNTAWATNEAMDAVFDVRAAAENVYTELQNALTRINELTQGASFASVDQEIKTEGQQIITILNQAKSALDDHTDFLDWRQP